MNKQVLIVSIGGSASNILNMFVKSMKNTENVIPLAIDTDIYSQSKLDEKIIKINLNENEMMDHLYERIESAIDETWFSDFKYKDNYNLLKILKTGNGAHSWRQQGFLSFVDYLINPEKIKILNSYFDLFVSNIKDKNYEVFFISSSNGGTGSGIFLSLALYFKKYIKEKHNLDIRIKMILTCPDIYSNSQNFESRKKAYANAYAALKELNAVNLVTSGFNNMDTDFVREPINFNIKIGDILLFDSKDKKFWDRSAFPFEKIYLFERIPTIMSVSTHEQIISSILSILCNNYKNDELSSVENIYAGISISKVQYPAEDNIDYLLHCYLLDELKNEWLFAFKIYEKKKKLLNIDNSKNQSKIDSILNFFNTILTNNKDNVNDLDFHLLNRGNGDIDEYYDVKYDLRNEEKILKELEIEFLDFINNYYNNINSTKIDNILSEKVDFPKISVFDSKKKKNEKKNILVKRVQLLGLEYKKFIIESIVDCFNKSNTDLNDYIDSTIAKLLTKENGEYVHPIIALYRLTNFYDKINIRFVYKNYISRLGNLSEEQLKYLTIQDIPSSIFKLKTSLSHGTNEYLKAGESIIINIIDKGDTSKLNKLNIDYKYIVEDFRDLVLDIKSDIGEFYFKNILPTFENIIHKYIEFFEKLVYSVDDLEYEVNELRNINTNDTLCIKNIGSSIEEKEQLYSEFKKSIKIKKDNDSIIGKLLFDQLNNCDIKDINRNSINKFRNKFLAIINEQMNNNSVIEKIRQRNVFESILKEKDSVIPIKELRKNFTGILNYNFRPLNLNYIMGEKNNKPNTDNYVLISQKLCEYICKEVDKFDLKSLGKEEKITEFFGKIGNFNNKISYTNLVNDKEILIIYEVYNLKLSWLRNIDEETSDSFYYKEFFDSLANKITTNSFLWNPSLYKIENCDIHLPTINLEKQIKNDIDCMKSLLYEFIDNKIIVSDVSSNIKKVYFHQETLNYDPIKYGDEYIKDGQINKVFKAFRNNLVFNIETSKKFDHYVDKLCWNLPYNDAMKGDFFNCIIESVRQSSFIDIIKNKFIQNIDVNNNEDIVYVDILIKMMIQIFDKMLKSRLANIKIEDNLLQREIKKLIIQIFLECYQDNIEYKKIIDKNFKK